MDLLETGSIDLGGSRESSGELKSCADCGTTKTPLWRAGPSGPKSLCNAWGFDTERRGGRRKGRGDRGRGRRSLGCWGWEDLFLRGRGGGWAKWRRLPCCRKRRMGEVEEAAML